MVAPFEAGDRVVVAGAAVVSPHSRSARRFRPRVLIGLLVAVVVAGALVEEMLEFADFRARREDARVVTTGLVSA